MYTQHEFGGELRIIFTCILLLYCTVSSLFPGKGPNKTVCVCSLFRALTVHMPPLFLCLAKLIAE